MQAPGHITREDICEKYGYRWEYARVNQATRQDTCLCSHRIGRENVPLQSLQRQRDLTLTPHKVCL
jgi:hypothetical protein